MIYGWEFLNLEMWELELFEWELILTVGQLSINLSIDWLAQVSVSVSAYQVTSYYQSYIHHTSPTMTPTTTPKLRNLFHSFYLNFSNFQGESGIGIGSRRFIIHTQLIRIVLLHAQQSAQAPRPQQRLQRAGNVQITEAANNEVSRASSGLDKRTTSCI